MPSYTYQKTIHTLKLSIEIENSSIEKEFSHMTTTNSPSDEVTLYFVESLTSSEKTELDNIIETHDPIEGVDDLTKPINRVSYSLINSGEGSLIDLLSFKVLAVLPWDITRGQRYKKGLITLETAGLSSGISMDIRVVDSTNAKILGSGHAAQNGFYQIEVSNPENNAGLELQARTSSLLTSPTIKGAVIEFDVE